MEVEISPIQEESEKFWLTRSTFPGKSTAIATRFFERSRRMRAKPVWVCTGRRIAGRATATELVGLKSTATTGETERIANAVLML